MLVLNPYTVKKRLDRKARKIGIESPELNLFRVDTKLSRRLNTKLIESTSNLLGISEAIKDLKQKKDECIFELCFDNDQPEIEKEYFELKKQGNELINLVIESINSNKYSDEELESGFPGEILLQRITDEELDELIEDFDKNKNKLLRIFIRHEYIGTIEQLNKISETFKEYVREDFEIL